MRIGGTEQVIKNLILGSDDQLFKMSIFCIEEPIGPFGRILLEKGISIVSANRREGFDLKLIKTIRQHIIKHKISILHCHQYTPWVYGALAAIGTDTKVIFTEHGRFYPDRSSWKRKIINPILVRLTDEITSISKATKQAMVEFEYIPENRIKVIYNGILPIEPDPEQTALLKKELKIKDTSLVIGTIARLDPIKNHSMMMNAFKLVLEQHPDTILILVGDGDERDNLEQLVDKLNIRQNIIFTGYISAPQRYLECMDIFLLPSLSEGTSMTLLEAMSLSKPCVVTDAGGNPEIIENGFNGIVSKNGDCKSFHRSIIKLFSNPNLLRNMGQNSNIRFKDKFNIKLMKTGYENLYQKLS